MFVLILKIFGFTVCLLCVVYTAATVWRSSRRLNQRIQQFKAEQEAQNSQPGAINPYAALAELYQERLPEPPRKRR